MDVPHFPLVVYHRRSIYSFYVLRADKVFKQTQINTIALNCLRADFIDILPVNEKVINVAKEIIGDYCHDSLLEIRIWSSASCFSLSETWI